MSISAVIVAAGRSERFGEGTPKQFRDLCGRPMLAWSIFRFEEAKSVDEIVLVVAEDWLAYAGGAVVDPYAFRKVRKIVAGGETRQQSVLRGLQALPKGTQFVAIHDGARPLISPADIDRAAERVEEVGAVIVAAPISDTVKRVADGAVVATLDRRHLYAAQTPQVFDYNMILQAHLECEPGTEYTDDASLIEARRYPVAVMCPKSPNPKITTPEDMLIAEAFLRREGYGQA